MDLKRLFALSILLNGSTQESLIEKVIWDPRLANEISCFSISETLLNDQRLEMMVEKSMNIIIPDSTKDCIFIMDGLGLEAFLPSSLFANG